MKNKFLNFLAVANTILFVLLIAGFTYNELLIPKVRLFGTNTTFSDSGSYVTLNSGFYAFDSIKTDRDLIVKERVILDTNRQISIGANGLNLSIINLMSQGNQYHSVKGTNSGYSWYYAPSSSDVPLMALSSTGLNVQKGGLSNSDNTTGFIQFPTLTSTERDALSPANGMVIYNETTSKLQVYGGGFWNDLH